MVDVEKRLKRLWVWILGFVSLGVLDSLWILALHFSHEKLAPACGISQRINCDVLQVGEYSEWVGIPVAFYSLLFYGFGGILAIWGSRQSKSKQFRPLLYLWFMAWLSVASTIYMAIVSVGILNTICVYCSVLYVVSIGFLISVGKAKKQLNQPWWNLVVYDVKNAHKNRWFWSTFIVVLILLIATHMGIKKWAFDRPSMSKEVHAISTIEQRTLGDPSSPVNITLFSDFQCPFCKTASEILASLEQELKGKVKITYKFYPLDHSCNRIMQRPMHREACLAGRAAYCAGKQNRFWLYHDLIYANQRSLSEEKMYAFVDELNMDREKFEACLRSRESLIAVQDDIEEAILLDLRGTPSVFIDGRKYQGPWTVSALKDAVNE